VEVEAGTADGTMFTLVDVATFLGDVPVQALSKIIKTNNEKVDLRFRR
jgi:hypothetical protein